MNENETSYQTTLETIRNMTALKILISPKVTGEMLIGVVFEKDETGYQEMRKQFHNYLLDSQMLHGPVAMELNAIMDHTGDLIGEVRTKAEGTDNAETVASPVISRLREGQREREKKKSESETNFYDNGSREWNIRISSA